MAFYRPDYKLQKATKLLESLDLNDEKNQLIIYYIDTLKKRNQKLVEENYEYQEVFDKMSKFLPNGRPTVYK
jgi:hypothetical protein